LYELTVIRKFSAAHQLRGYEGECENLHGHTYQVEVRVRAEALDEIGLAVDFKELKRFIDGLLEQYDHGFLNDVPPFDDINPSAENMARVIFEDMKKDLPEGITLSKVVVWESENASAAYFED
jgi:6-pyruvoyltetrahydropterin/6-carboxytetrahydropterin synthase